MGNFSKKYKSLKSKKEITRLFSEGEKLKSGSILVLHQPSEDTTEVAFSVKKKDFKLAVDRNRIKRLMKEAFRLNQNELSDTYRLFFIHLGDKKQEFTYYEEKIKSILIRLNENEE